MNKIINILFVILFMSFLLYSCSEDNPVNTNQPPISTDTNYFVNIRDKLPQWTLANSLNQVKIVNEKIWVTVFDNFMYYSNDSGNTFTKIGLNNILPFIKMNSDGINGWCGGENLLYTSNSGLNWSYYAVSINVLDFYFLNPSTGFLLCTQNNVKMIGKTTNSGLNWNYQNVIFEGSSPIALTSFCFPDSISSNLIFLGTTNGLYKSTNEGLNWNVVNFSSGSPNVSKIYFQSRNRLWVCGSNGFLASYSGNDIWKVYQINNAADILTSICFARDGQNGWITTDKNYVFQTTDSGNNWIKRYFGQNYAGKLNDVYTVSDKIAYFVGEGSMFFKYQKK